MKNLVLDLVSNVATQFMIWIPPGAPAVGSEPSDKRHHGGFREKTKQKNTQTERQRGGESGPRLETNCDVTPTSKEANTGEWSLVVMSLVQPEGQVTKVTGRKPKHQR